MHIKATRARPTPLRPCDGPVADDGYGDQVEPLIADDCASLRICVTNDRRKSTANLTVFTFQRTRKCKHVNDI